MEWFNQVQSLMANNPAFVASLIVALIAGLVAGWLLAYLPARRSKEALRERNARLEASLANNKLDGDEARGQLDLLRGELRNAAASQAELHNQLLAAQELNGQRERTIQQGDATNERLSADLSRAQVELAAARQALLDRPEEMEALRAAAEEATKSLTDKQTALDEAYSRAAALLQMVEEYNTRVSSLEAQINGLQSDLDMALAQRRSLEAHLHSVRGNVASEMVRVTQALVKAKDEQLSEANERYEALLMELTTRKAQEN